MPQIIIKDPKRGGSRTAVEQPDVKVLVVVTPEQVEIYTDQEAVDKLSEG